MSVVASDPVGKVTSMVIKSTDNTGNKYETSITTASSKIVVNPSITYTQVDTAARALNALSTNSYDDTILLTQYSVTEILVES